MNFGHLLLPAGLKYPRPQKITALSTLDHGVRSDRVVVVDAQTFLIPNFSYDGTAPGIYAPWNRSRYYEFLGTAPGILRFGTAPGIVGSLEPLHILMLLGTTSGIMRSLEPLQVFTHLGTTPDINAPLNHSSYYALLGTVPGIYAPWNYSRYLRSLELLQVLMLLRITLDNIVP